VPQTPRLSTKDIASIIHQSAESTKEPDEFDLWERDQSIFSQIGDEFDSFIDGNPIVLGERETSLSRWLEEVQRRTYPSLSQFAIDILSIPAMLAEPDRVFSGCWRTISWQRMRLGVKAVEGECLKPWIRSGVVAGLRVGSEGTENLEAGDGFLPN
jgi:hAT family C-terminal dimerisation region